MKDYDQATAFLGEWGRFQQVVFFLLCASTVPNGLGVFSIVFLADIPKHHCLIPDVNLTKEWNDAIIPVEVISGREEQSRCSRYRLDVVRNLSAQGLVPHRDVNLTNLPQEACLDGWSYSKDIYHSTIVSEFDLVCDDQWRQPLTSSAYLVGVLIGSFFSGPLSDRFGRKLVLFATMAVQTIFSFLQVFSPSWTIFTVLFFLSGLGQIANYLSALVLGMEILQGNVRVLYSTLGVCLCFAIGYMMLPLLAFFLRDWRSLQLVISLLGLVYIPLWWFIPESPRWLLSQRRVKEAAAIVRRAAEQNKVEAPKVIFGDNTADEVQAELKERQQYTILDLFRTSHVRAVTLILFQIWVTLQVSYVCFSLNSSNLHPDPYLGCFIFAAVEVPSYICSWLALKLFPRRVAMCAVSLLFGLSLYAVTLVPESYPALTISLQILGKFVIACGSAMVFAYTGELYPTGLRHTATGTCGMVSRVAGSLSPFILELRFIYSFLPYTILGTLAMLGAVTTYFLPESFGKPLPETLDQMQISRGSVCQCVTRKEKTPTVQALQTRM